MISVRVQDSHNVPVKAFQQPFVFHTFCSQQFLQETLNYSTNVCTDLCPVWDCSGTDPLSSMDTPINPVDRTLPTLPIANLQYKYDIMRHVKYYVSPLSMWYPYPHEFSLCYSPTKCYNILNWKHFQQFFHRYKKSFSSPLHNGETSSLNLSSNPNVPLDLGTLTKT